MSKTQTLDAKDGIPFGLTCPAQGSPVPAFRWVFGLTQEGLFPYVEPIGSAKPKFSSILKLSAFQKEAGEGVALTCPAQGSPLPGFR